MRADTIAALATPPGEGAIAILRLSGPDAVAIAAAVFTGPVADYKTHTAHYGHIVDRKGATLDAVLLLVMRAPRSYTGEDIVEIHCHGGSLVCRRVLERLLEAGARAAQPGEFSLRAFLNGKLDLSQAEAVQQVIAARSERALLAAQAQLDGALSTRLRSFEKELTAIAAILEAWVDFPEEGLEFATFDALIERLVQARTAMQRLADTFHEGRKLHEGLTLALAGTPNVGKSSLLNALLGHNRAIVTPIAGTTRDLLAEEFHLSGYRFRLLDTAGIRDTSEVVEQEGIRRSREAMGQADLVLLLLDASRPLNADDEALLAAAPPERTLTVWNKVDLAPASGLAVSAKTGTGLAELKSAILARVQSASPTDEIVLTQARHREALLRAIAFVDRVIDGLKTRSSAEFVSFDLRCALSEMGSLLGTNVTEEILSSIFSQFCLGK